jgi:hypothetical protein
MTRSGLREWESTQRQTALGAVESERVLVPIATLVAATVVRRWVTPLGVGRPRSRERAVRCSGSA